MNLFRLPVELFGKRGDRLDHMLTAIEYDEKLSRPNEVDQLQAWIFRFECKSQGGRDGHSDMVRIGEAFKIDKIDLAAEPLSDGAADGQGNGRLTDATGTEQRHKPIISKLVADLPDHRLASDHRDRSHRKPALVRRSGAPAFRGASEGNHRAGERVAPSLDVCDEAVAELAVTQRLADRGHVDPDAPLLDGHVRPDVIDQLLLCDHLTGRSTR
ncbi:hypothetical protein ACVWZW_003903 [Bradyrhizobium sp. F1.13.4]